MQYSKKTTDLAAEIVTQCTACGRCMKDCLFLQNNCETPKAFFEKVVQGQEIESVVPYSCLLCGHCQFVCPQKLQLDAAFLSMRQDLMAQQKQLPLKALKGVLFHQKFSTSALFTTVKKSGDKK
ncbi:4Fe-4S dicluster domain-containing protein [Agrilactobacillus yilanensis]|uniref:4Fe-4S dicluster domain-containing protein n=1 Tax=Agrilactobacillus yilanensis TaxID=2485997 RepID=A0ABW4J6B8_9LACO|nr:4Fe-4S dicluster domain-containing protein [Agrilactobacillus yilanensis]